MKSPVGKVMPDGRVLRGIVAKVPVGERRVVLVDRSRSYCVDGVVEARGSRVNKTNLFDDVM